MIHLFRKNGRYFAMHTSTLVFVETAEEDWFILRQKSSTPDTLSDEDLKQFISQYQGIRPQLCATLGCLLPTDAPQAGNVVQTETYAVKSLVLFLTEACNLGCVYCYEKDHLASLSRTLKFSQVKNCLEQLPVCDSLAISFYGGEPLLQFDLLRRIVEHVQEAVVPKGCSVTYSLTTNGLALTEEMMCFLEKWDFGVVFSFDGPYQSSQRPVRTGREHSATVEKNLMSLLKKLGSDKVTTRATFTADTLNLINLFNYLVALGVTNMAIEPAILPPHHPLALNDPGKVIQAFEDLAFHYVRAKRDHPEIQLTFFDKYAQRILRPRHYKRQCGLGNGLLALGSDGNLYPCQMLAGYDHLSLGSCETGLVHTDLQRELRDISVDTTPECVQCWARYVCGGICPAEAHIRTNTLTANDPLSCQLRRELVHLSAWISAELAQPKQ